MSVQPLQWMMNAPAAPLAAVNSAPDPGPGEVVVEIAGCGGRHTGRGGCYDGERTPMDKAEIRLLNLIAYYVRASGNRGRPPELHPGAFDLLLSGRSKLSPYVEKHPLNDINRIFEAVPDGELKHRAVLVPAA